MYTPDHFDEKDFNKLSALVQKLSFGVLLTTVDGRTVGTHLPFMFRQGQGQKGTLLAHMAKANTAWQHFDREVLVVFGGPHAYISPLWYEIPNQVPTWNYISAHVYGHAKAIHDPERISELLDESIRTFDEANAEHVLELESPEFRQAKVRQIVGVEIEVTEIQGKFKLNQNKPLEVVERVITRLESNGDTDSLALAQEMRAYYAT